MDGYLSSGSTRERIDPATEDKQRDIESKLDKLIDWQCTDLLAGPDEISVTPIAKTLEELGLIFETHLRKITLVPAAAGIFWGGGNAVAGINPLPTNGVEIFCTENTISTRKFITASGTVKLQVVQEG